MSAALLLAYAGVLPVLGSAWLRGAAWTARAPRLAIFTWFSLAVSVVSALVSAGILLVVPATGLHRGAADFLRACFAALEWRHGPTGAWLVGGFSLLLAVILPAALIGVAVLDGIRRHRHRRAHLSGVRASAKCDGSGILVLDHETAAAYCLPGSGGTIVVTTGALKAVDDAGLAAVRAHEQAHLDGRHHVLAAIAGTLAQVLGFLPLFADLPSQIARLVELRADDVAAAANGRRVLATSLLAFAESRVAPAGSLPAAGNDAVGRIERLVTSQPHLNRTGAVGIAATGTLALALPVAVTVVTMATVTYMACCAR